MSASQFPRRPSGPANLLTRVLASIGAAVALVVSFFLGAVVFVMALGLMVIVIIGVMIRIWWLRRQFREQRRGGDGDDDGPSGGGVIEGEYVIIEKGKVNPRERR